MKNLNTEDTEDTERATPETDAFFAEWTFTSGVLARSRLHAEKLERERDEARAVADGLASVALHCLGWHDHECPDAAIKIAAALKRWKKSK